MSAPLLTAGQHLRHMHFGDSNRLAPGRGHLNFPEIVATLAAGREVLDAVYIVAFVVWFVGLVLVAITTATAHDLPRWSAVPLPLGALTATAFWAHGGSALLGAAWIALGLLLLRRTSTTRP